jgi:hypothetical protein
MRAIDVSLRRALRSALVVLVIGALLVPGASTARAAQSFSAIPSPGIPGTVCSYTLNVTLNGYFGGNTLVTLQFDPDDAAGTAMFVPSSVDASTILIYAGGVSSPANYLSVSGPQHVLQFRTALAADTHSVMIVINQNAGLKPLTVGTHTVSVTVGGETLTASYTAQQSTSSSTPVTISSVTASTTALGAASGYTVRFSLVSTLFPAVDTIYVKFPTGFSMPVTMDGSNFGLIQGSRVVMDFSGSVTIDGSTIALRIPAVSAQTGNYAYFDASSPLELRCGPYTGIRNPTQGGTFTFEVWTSRQTTHATYQYTLGTGVTSFQATADPAVTSANADYRFSFVTSQAGLLSTSDAISITFPAGFVVPSALPAGSVQVGGTTASTTVLGQTVTMRCPIAVGAGQSVQVVISRQAGICNAAVATGTNRFSLVTSTDALAVQSAPVTLVASAVQPAAVTVTPAVRNASVDIAVQFAVGAGGALQPGSTISIAFPAGFVLPASIVSGTVNIRTPAATGTSMPIALASVTLATQTIVLTLPSGTSVAAGTTVLITIPVAAGIRSPQSGGDFALAVSTAREPTPVQSTAFTVFANPVSTLTVSPNAPDGKAGAYVTQPSFTLSVKGPASLAISAFYRIDQAGAYVPYDVKTTPPVKIPEGTHTVFYYAQDSLGNVEPTHTQQFTVDLTDPVITVTSPVEKAVVVQATTTVTGKVACLDPASVQLTINGQAVAVAADGAFSAPVTFSHEGDNAITLTATSPSGRTKTMTLTVNYIARVTMSLVIGSSTVNLNNEFKTLEAAPFISKKGVTMVPLRFISEAFKADVVWDPVFKSVTITLGGKILRIQVGFLTADVSGKSFALQDAPVIVKGRTFVPLRFIAENFGAQVEWNAALKMVSIVYPKP